MSKGDDKQQEDEAFFAALEREAQVLRSDEAQWRSFQAELAEWDGTLMDGLEDEPWEE